MVCADEREWVHNCVQEVQQSSYNICGIYTSTKDARPATGTLSKIHTHAPPAYKCHKMHSNIFSNRNKIGPRFSQFNIKIWAGVLRKCSSVVMVVMWGQGCPRLDQLCQHRQSSAGVSMGLLAWRVISVVLPEPLLWLGLCHWLWFRPYGSHAPDWLCSTRSA